jgi:hypothetical protein
MREICARAKGFVLVSPPACGEGVGLKADVPDHLLFVAGGTTGAAHVYDSRTGALDDLPANYPDRFRTA